MAYIYHIEGDYQKEKEANKELRNLTEGTHNYFAQASAAFNLCMHEIDNKNINQAKIYFDEAEYLNYAYALDLEEKLDELEYRFDKAKGSFSKPEYNSNELISDLYELLSYYPDEKDELLRFWLYFNGNDLFCNYRLLDGLKLMIVTDNTKNFLKLSELLYPYSELFIQSFYQAFEKGKATFFHYPRKRLIPKGISIPLVKADQDRPENFANVKLSTKVSHLIFHPKYSLIP